MKKKRDLSATDASPKPANPSEGEKTAGEAMTPEEQKAAAQAALRAKKQKAHKRRMRSFRNLILRTVLLALVVYVLFFQLVGLAVMPSGDMYPRIDAGDMVLFYRLDKDMLAQDIVVFEKDAAALEEFKASADSLNAAAEAVEAAREDAPGAPPPPALPDTPPEEAVQTDTFMDQVNRWVYDALRFLNLRRPDGKQLFICRLLATAGDTVEVTEEGRLIVNGNAMIESNIFYQTYPYVGFTEYPLTLQPGECFVMADQRNGGADCRFFGPVREEEILGTVITIARRNNL